MFGPFQRINCFCFVFFFFLTGSGRSVLCQKWYTCYWQSLLKIIIKIERKKNILAVCAKQTSEGTEYYFLPAQGCYCTPEWRRFLKAAVHTSNPIYIYAWLNKENKMLFISFFTVPTSFCPILSQLHVCLGGFMCLIVVTYLFEFHWRSVGRLMSNTEYAISFIVWGKNGF